MSESVSTLGSVSVTNNKSKVPKCLIACSGSVATLKIPELVAELSPHFEVMVICTSSAAFFLEKSEVYNEAAWKKFELAGGWNLVLKDEDEWQMWNTMGNSVLHIEMRRWADILVVAPASANVIAKSSYGIADNFVLSVMRAWDFRKPCVLCPAMNTVMWTHPTTGESLHRLQSWGWDVLGPVEKVLACNDKGNGAMVSVQDIKSYLLSKFTTRSPGSSHALTDSNLQLHTMLLNSSNPTSLSTEHLPHASSTKLKAKLAASKGASPSKETQAQTPADTETSPGNTTTTPATSTQHQANQLATSGPVQATLVVPAPAESPIKPHISTAAVVAPKSSWKSVLFSQFCLGIGLGVGMMGTTFVLGVFVALLQGGGSGSFIQLKPDDKQRPAEI